MNWLGNLRNVLRTLSVFALILAVCSSALPQHEGHVMPKKPAAAKPKPKAAPKRRTRASPRPATRKPTAVRPRLTFAKPTDDTGHADATASPSPSPSPHVMTPGMQMPAASPSPSPGHVMTPGMQMTQPPADIQRPRREVIPAAPIIRLEDLEAMALQRNPTLAQAEACDPRS